VTAETPTDVCELTLAAAADLVRRRELSPLDLTRATLDRIESLNPELNCFLSVAADQALERAARLSEDASDGRHLGPLHGIPISLKDNIATVGLPTTAGSTLLSGWQPERPAAVTRRLERQGAIVIGKTHLFEFAYGDFNPRYGDTRNPWNPDYVAGGSSSGSAAALAARLGYASVGTDTGGSIRIPASFCGVVGMKPTFGSVSLDGVIPISSNLDHVGPMARTAEDTELLLKAMLPPARARPAFSEAPEAVAGLRIGVPAPQASERVDDEVRAAVDQAIAVLEGEGAELRQVELPDLVQARTAMWVISCVEGAERHRPWLRERADEYHPLVRSLLEQGARIPATEYVHAQRVRQVMVQRMRRVFDAVDVVALPATAVPAFPIGTETLRLGDADEHWQSTVNRCTPLFNLTGGPALSLPCGLSNGGMPIGLQLAARAHDDARLLRTARAYERATDWHTRAPRPAGVA
jgi:aspartyl-tRNA(Asn)/glutamyl-tRNA(Gln) amidotransferase subunit A